jgi:predicted permease
MIARIASFFRNRFRRTRVERDLDDEVRAYIDMLTAEKVRAGLSHEDARRAAMLSMRGVEHTKDAVRDVRTGAWIDQLGRDIRIAIRSLRRTPAFTALTLGIMALGIGGVTVVFSVVKAVLLTPLPYDEPDQLVVVAEADSGRPADWYIVSAPNYIDWKAQSRSFTHMAMYEYLDLNIAGDGDAEAVSGLRATGEVFTALGATPMLGRALDRGDDTPGTHVAVLSEGLWRRRYGADSSVVGRTMLVNAIPHTIVGVMRRGFAFPSTREALWIPINLTEHDAERGAHSFHVIGRLRPGVTVANAAAEMERIGDALRREYPATNSGETVTAFPMKDLWITRSRETLGLVFAAVGLVMVIATVNVASLLLARGATRRRELAVRTAIGGSRAQLVRQLVTESLVLSVLGAALALVLAFLALPVVVGALPNTLLLLPFRALETITLSPSAFLVALGVAIAAGVVSGVVPALQSLPAGPWEVLVDGESRGSSARHGRRAQNTFVAFEVGLALVVLVSAGLLVASVRRTSAIDPGFDARGVMAFNLPLPQEDFYGPPTRPQFCADAERLVRAVPGVAAVGAVSHIPLSGANAGRGFVIEGRPAPAPGANPGANFGVSCPGYFGAMRIPLAAGRDFAHADGLNAPLVVIVNDALARRYFPGENPIGKRMKFGRFDSPTPWLTIVGVARDVRHSSLQTDVDPYLYRPYSQVVWPRMDVIVRAQDGAALPAAAVRRALRESGTSQPVSEGVALTSIVDRSLGHLRFSMQLLSSFALIAVLLAAAGIFGVASQAVSRRTRELGIRAAIGASPRDLYGLVLRQSMRPVAAGLMGGVAGSLVATRLVQSLLFGIERTDVATYGVVAALLAGAAMVASSIPAFRASRMDPVEALRSEQS